MTTGLDLNDRELRDKCGDRYHITSNAHHKLIYYYIFFPILDFLRLADDKTLNEDARFLIHRNYFVKENKYQAKYITRLMAQVDFNNQTDFNLTMYL